MRPVISTAMPRIISLAMTLFMTLSMAGCATAAPVPTSAPGTVSGIAPVPADGLTAIGLPASAPPVTLTVFAGLDSNLIGIIDDYNENLFFQELQRRTGVQLEFIMPGTEKEQEVYNEMIASGQMADIVTHEGNSYPDGWDAAVEDGIYLDLTPWLDTLLADYDRVRTSDPFVEKCSKTPSGRIVSLPIIHTDPQGPWMGLQVRKDWLDELQLPLPVTFDDWEEMLIRFKREKGAYAPLSMGQNGYLSISHAMSAGFGAMESFMQVDGQVVYGPITDGWREYLAKMRSWYGKGLIDPDFMLNGAWQADMEMIVSGETGAWNAMYTMISQYESAGSGIEVVPVASPVVQVGDAVHIRREDSVVGNAVAISAICRHPEVAMRLMNYLYTEEGSLLANYGIENDTFTFGTDGKPVVTDKIRNNPEFSMPQAQALHLMPPSRFGGLYDWTRELAAVPGKDIVALEVWASADDDWILPPQLTYGGKEAGERAAIVSQTTAYMNECTVRFIIGTMDLETDWVDYVAALRGMGIARAVEITQEALDRFNR